MKKLLITLMIFTSLASKCLAYDSLNTNEYINTLNTYTGEMNMNLEDETEGSIYKSIVKGFDNGYLIPEINKLELTKSSITGLANNIKDINITNAELQSKHDDLIQQYKIVIDLLDKDIAAKKQVLDTDCNYFTKVSKMLKIDRNETAKVNKQIDKINKIYAEINDNF